MNDISLSHRVQRIKPSPTLAVTARAAELRAAGHEILVVSSGAIAMGRTVLDLPKGSLKLEESQAAAAVGQIALAREHFERGEGYMLASTWLQCPPPGPHQVREVEAVDLARARAEDRGQHERIAAIAPHLLKHLVVGGGRGARLRPVYLLLAVALLFSMLEVNPPVLLPRIPRFFYRSWNLKLLHDIRQLVKQISCLLQWLAEKAFRRFWYPISTLDCPALPHRSNRCGLRATG